MIGDFASTVCVMYLDSETPQFGFGREDVVQPTPASQGVDVGVFQQDQRVGPVSGGNLSMDASLDLQPLGVGYDAELDY